MFLEHIFKKWALLKSFCRPSVRLSICLSVRYFSVGIAPREHLIKHKSIGVCVSIVQSGILDLWLKNTVF
jgi:hypothetical protein